MGPHRSCRYVKEAVTPHRTPPPLTPPWDPTARAGTSRRPSAPLRCPRSRPRLSERHTAATTPSTCCSTPRALGPATSPGPRHQPWALPPALAPPPDEAVHMVWYADLFTPVGSHLSVHPSTGSTPHVHEAGEIDRARDVLAPPLTPRCHLDSDVRAARSAVQACRARFVGAAVGCQNGANGGSNPRRVADVCAARFARGRPRVSRSTALGRPCWASSRRGRE